MFTVHSCVIALLLLSSIVLADTYHPSQDVILIHPAGTVNLNDQVELGYNFTAPPGLAGNISVSIQYPNGTTIPIVASEGDSAAGVDLCTLFNSSERVSGSATMDALGT
jgi:hypothetical protein